MMMTEMKKRWQCRRATVIQVQIFGTDLDNESIEAARVGRYPGGIGVDVSPQRLERYFTHDDSTYSIRKEIRDRGCTRAVLVGHNPSFDLGFINAAVQRAGYKRNPFHPFSYFDTATLSGLAYGQTVLSRSVQAAGLEWNESEAHSAIYDTEKTAALFCAIVNRWKILTGF